MAIVPIRNLGGGSALPKKFVKHYDVGSDTLSDDLGFAPSSITVTCKYNKTNNVTVTYDKANPNSYVQTSNGSSFSVSIPQTGSGTPYTGIRSISGSTVYWALSTCTDIDIVAKP